MGKARLLRRLGTATFVLSLFWLHLVNASADQPVTHKVAIDSVSFKPATLTVRQGDTIV